MNTVATYEFDFDNRPESLMPCTRRVLDFLSVHLARYSAVQTVLFKAKYIVTELLTNAMKHSGVTGSHLVVQLTGNVLTIEKTDKGKPLPIIERFNLSPGVKTALSHDAMHRLYVKMNANKVISFLCEERDLDAPDINQVSEHFGLLIITKTTDAFTYRYDAPVNIFTATISLNSDRS